MAWGGGRMSEHETILGHLIGWGLRRRYEDAATEGLAFLLDRYRPLRERFVALLRAAQPALPEELRFTTQESIAAGRPDKCGRHGEAIRVFVEAKFGAALTDTQPIAYLDHLAAEPAPTLLLFIVPEWRRLYLWRELLERLKAGQVEVREQNAQTLEIAGRSHDQRMHIVGWGAVLAALRAGAGDEETRMNVEQLAGLCRTADEGEARPLLREELTDPQAPARMIQYVNVVRGVVDRGCEGVFRGVSRGTSFYWYAIGQKIQFAGDKGPVAWLGVDLLRWKKFETGPLWLTFDWNFGQARLVRERVHAWVAEHKRVLHDFEEGIMLSLELLVGREQQAVVDDVIGQLRTIAGLLRAAPGKPA
jgi:hypothetical protein